MAGKKETAIANLKKAHKKTRKGVSNKRTSDVLSIIQAAHNSLVRAKKDLSVQAKKDPQWFYQYIWAKIIPRDLKIDLPEDFKIIVTKE